MLRTIRLYQGLALLSLSFVSSAAIAQEACASLDTGITLPRVQDYAPLIADAAGTTPEAVEFISFAESDDWSMVYAATPVVDPGFFFFESVDGGREFKDVWGGIASVSERDEQVAWAEALGAPADLAACFADQTAVIDE